MDINLEQTLPFKDISDKDALKITELLGGADHLSPESQIAQVKQLFTTNNFFTQQTNITGANWFKVFEYIEGLPDAYHETITGWKTVEESKAYDKGREDQEKVMIDWIKKWDGKTNSALGALLDKVLASNSGEITKKYAAFQSKMIAIKYAIWMDVNAVRNGADSWTTGAGNETKNWNSSDLYNHWLKEVYQKH